MLPNQSPTLENPLAPDETKDLPVNIYDEKDKEYLSFLQRRLENAKRQKEQAYPELKGKTYYEQYDENERLANTVLPKKENDDDVVISSGTIEQKLDSLLSHINNLNLSPDVSAFDSNNTRIISLGHALEDIMHDCCLRDRADGAGDEEKRIARQRVLLKQGTVFVQQNWLTKWETKKVLKQNKKDYAGEFKNFAGYTEKLVKVFEGPNRELLYGPNVFLGDITKFYMEDQPFAYTVELGDYDIAKTVYGKFENWQYVRRGAVPQNDASQPKTIYDNKWQLTELKENQVEIIRYQDQPGDEFQIIINGVLMMPIGYPLSAVCAGGKYNIAKQVFRIINDHFAYGQSFVASGSIQKISDLVDEMLKLFVLKTRKSITPAYINTSGRVINKKVLSPGRISMGLQQGDLMPINGNEVQGVTAGEANFLEKLQNTIDKSTVSEQFTGQQGRSGMTATEVSVLQNQARLTLGLVVAVCALLEQKISYLLLYCILDNWFEPTDSRVVEIEGARKLVNTYRRVTREVSIPDAGPGERTVITQDGELPSDQTIRDAELADEKRLGKPVRRIYINSEGIRNAGLYWYITINTKERESSPLYKMTFREMLGDLLTMSQFGSAPNREWIEDEFSKVWNKSRTKAFTAEGLAPELAQGTSDSAPGAKPADAGSRPNQNNIGAMMGAGM